MLAKPAELAADVLRPRYATALAATVPTGHAPRGHGAGVRGAGGPGPAGEAFQPRPQGIGVQRPEQADLAVGLHKGA